MSEPADWARAYARQADADFRAWELYERHPEAVSADCHKLFWEAGDTVASPLDWTFHPLRLVAVPAGRTFVKLLRKSIDRILIELGD